MDKLRAKDFRIKSEIVREPIHEDHCWHYVIYNGCELHKSPTKTEARRYISELVKYANVFLVENPEAFTELSEKVNQAKKLLDEGQIDKNSVPPVIKEAMRVKELLDPLQNVINKQKEQNTERKKADMERE